MMKKFDKSIVNEKDIQREIEFCQHSHRCFTPFYGFLMEKEYHNMTGLIYEFMSNGSLKSFVKENKFDEINNDIYLLMTINRIYEGIKYLHDKSFVHRDLKPSNILINHNNLAFISDFETIRSVDSSDPFTADVGSPLYTSPEQNESNIVSYPTDIYSFGLIIYYLYEKNNMWSYYSNKKDRIKQITKCPNAIKTLYENCVQRLPENRIKTHEIRNALNECFNTFSYLEEYLNDEKRSINDRYIIDFIFEKIFNQPINNKTSLQEQIRSFHQLFLLKIKESKLCLLSKTPKYEDITDYLNYINMDKYNSRTLNYIGTNYMNGTGVEKNYLKAKEYFEKSSEFQNSTAILNLGILYAYGYGVNVEYLKAKQYFERSMELYNSFAFLEMGNLYFHGRGVEKDYKKAIVYYKKSKTSYGLCLIGLAYVEGTEKNYKKAKKYYEKASLLNNFAALNNLGLLYDGGLGVKQDYLKAKECFEKSAELNNSSGLNNLGVLYAKGQGVEKDYIKAKKYFEESSLLGNSFAFANLGDLYYSGHGVKQDYLKAKECYEKASKQNNSYSTNILGILYENNLGVSQDYFTARKYYDIASKLENSDALNNSGNLYYYGHGVEQDYLKAKDYFEQSSELNNSNAFVNLGNLYYYGNGVKQDYFKAKEFYEKSSKFNNSNAFVNLGILYYYGRGVKQDYFKAKEYFKISSKTSAALFYLGDLYSMENSIDFDLSKAILYFLKSINAKSGIITSYNDIDSSFNVRFESNNYRNISFNNLALIYIFVFNDLEKGEKYLKESAFAEYPFGQNNLGLFFQFYLNKTYEAEYLFSRSSKHNFSLVFNDPNILFDFVIENSCSGSNIKTIFINEIKSIIDIMKSILYTPPYSILFGRISLDNRKSQNVKREKSINIDTNFYEGFGI